MKYFAKKELDNSFGGWYLPEVHETMFDVIIQENGEKIIIPKFDYVECSEGQYNQLMNNLKGELRFNKQGQLIDYVKKIMPEGMLKGEYNYDTETWINTATDLEKVQAQINEYSELDTPSTLKEMGTELANECMDMLIQLRNMAYTLENQTTIEDRDLLVLPKPSSQLEAFKNRFNKFF